MRIACWIPTATNTGCVILTASTMVERTRIDVAFYVYCLPCYYLSDYGILRPKHVTSLKLLIN
jgi:hypothetical protein